MAAPRLKVKFIRSNEVEVAERAVGSDDEMESNPFKHTRSRRRYEIYSPLRSFHSSSSLNRIDEVSESEIDSEDDSTYETSGSISTVVTNASLSRSINRSIIHAIERELARMKRIQRRRATLAAKKAAQKSNGDDEESDWKQQYDNPADHYRMSGGAGSSSKKTSNLSRSNSMMDIKRNSSRSSVGGKSMSSNKQILSGHISRNSSSHGASNKRILNSVTPKKSPKFGISKSQQPSGPQSGGKRSANFARYNMQRNASNVDRSTAPTPRLPRENSTHLHRSKSFVNQKQQQNKQKSTNEKGKNKTITGTDSKKELQNQDFTDNKTVKQNGNSVQEEELRTQTRNMPTSNGHSVAFDRLTSGTNNTERPTYYLDKTPTQGKHYYIKAGRSLRKSEDDSNDHDNSFSVRISHLQQNQKDTSSEHYDAEPVTEKHEVENMSLLTSDRHEGDVKELKERSGKELLTVTATEETEKSGHDTKVHNKTEEDNITKHSCNVNDKKENVNTDGLTTTSTSEYSEDGKSNNKRVKDRRSHRNRRLSDSNLTNDSIDMNEKIEKYFSSMESLNQISEPGHCTDRTDKKEMHPYDVIPEESLSTPNKSTDTSYLVIPNNSSEDLRIGSVKKQTSQTDINEQTNCQPCIYREKTNKVNFDKNTVGSEKVQEPLASTQKRKDKSQNKTLGKPTAMSTTTSVNQTSRTKDNQQRKNILQREATGGYLKTNKDRGSVINSKSHQKGSLNKVHGSNLQSNSGTNSLHRMNNDGGNNVIDKTELTVTRVERSVIKVGGTLIPPNSKSPAFLNHGTSFNSKEPQSNSSLENPHNLNEEAGAANVNFSPNNISANMDAKHLVIEPQVRTDVPDYSENQQSDQNDTGLFLQERMLSFIDRERVATPCAWESDITSFMNDMLTPGRLGKAVRFDDQHIKLEVAQILSDMTGFIAHQEDILNSEELDDGSNESVPETKADSAQEYDTLRSPKDYDRYMSLPQSRIGATEDSKPIHNIGDKSYRSEIVAGDFSSSHKIKPLVSDRGFHLPKITLKSTSKIISTFPNLLKEYGLPSAKGRRQPPVVPVEERKKKPRAKIKQDSPTGGYRRKDNYFDKIQTIVNEQMVKYDDYVKHMTDKVERQREGMKKYFEEKEKKFAEVEEEKRRSQLRRTTHEYVDDTSFMKVFPKTSYYKVTDMYDKMRREGKLKNQLDYDNFWETVAKPEISKKKPYHSQGLYPMTMSDDNIISKVREASKGKYHTKMLLPLIPKPKPILITDNDRKDTSSKNK